MSGVQIRNETFATRKINYKRADLIEYKSSDMTDGSFVRVGVKRNWTIFKGSVVHLNRHGNLREWSSTI
jgi:hypothetical protein